LQGQRGEKGNTGERGPSGGEPGAIGPTGERGQEGQKGEQGKSVYAGSYDSTKASQLFYEVGDIVLFGNGDFYVLNNKLNQKDPTSDPPQQDSDGWRPIRGVAGPQGSTGRSLYRGVFDPTATYSDGDVVRSSANNKLYQLIGVNNGYPELASSNWALMSGDTGATGERGFNGTKGNRGEKGEQGLQGDRGFNGSTGARGEQGRQGNRGFNGTDGKSGATGAVGSKGDVGRSTFRGVYEININAEYIKGDIVEWNEEIYALIEESSGGIPSQSSAWLSLKGVPGVNGQDTGLALGWVMMIAVLAALIISTGFFLVYYFFFRSRIQGREDINFNTRGNTYYSF